MNFFALGIATKDPDFGWLDFFYQQPLVLDNAGLVEKIKKTLRVVNSEQIIDHDKLVDLQRSLAPTKHYPPLDWLVNNPPSLNESQFLVGILLVDDLPVSTVGEAYLKLHLLSYRLAKPNSLNLTNLFKVLPTVAWTNHGPIAMQKLAEQQFKARLSGDFILVRAVDKFPPLTDYLVPSNVRIADTARVRLGAYLGPGTTVMHEGFINFNAGTAGPNMVEGRISAGVWLAPNSDLGGGASTMGTLSGGGTVLISVGENCLIGANAGLGIPLGDNCTIEAGLYITAGSKISLLDNNGELVQTVKAHQLAARSNLLFRRNSLSGKIECLHHGSPAELNKLLHDYN